MTTKSINWNYSFPFSKTRGGLIFKTAIFDVEFRTKSGNYFQTDNVLDGLGFGSINEAYALKNISYA
jgi:hypothetical protein